MPVNDIVEDFANWKSVKQNQGEEIAVSIQPVAVLWKPFVNEMQNIIFHEINYMVVAMGFGPTLFGF